MGSVMVVEHDAVLRARMADALSKAGFDVEEVSGGQAALARLNEGGCPSLILLDLNLQDPGMNGWEFRAALLQDPDRAHIPVCVVIDAGTEEETAERLCAAGVLRHAIRDVPLVRMVTPSAGCGDPCRPRRVAV